MGTSIIGNRHLIIALHINTGRNPKKDPLAHNEAGALYRVDPSSGEAPVVYGPPNDPPLQGADGMSRRERTLHAVENAASQISVIRLNPSTGTGTLQKVLQAPFVGPYKIFRVGR